MGDGDGVGVGVGTGDGVGVSVGVGRTGGDGLNVRGGSVACAVWVAAVEGDDVAACPDPQAISNADAINATQRNASERTQKAYRLPD